jgi:hypothetical protein
MEGALGLDDAVQFRIEEIVIFVGPGLELDYLVHVEWSSQAWDGLGST